MKGIGLKIMLVLVASLLITQCSDSRKMVRQIDNFSQSWRFNLGDLSDAERPEYDDSNWRTLDLPHDWSIEGEFSEEHPATPGGGALPGGIGWYRKTFTVSEGNKDKSVFIDFDGVYQNSEVWINGHSLGKRPYGYSSFRYELTPYLNYGDENNIIAVKVDNSQQPNSRWYSGSGIYRNVWLVVTDKVFVDHWGTFVTTPEVSSEAAKINIKTNVRNQTGLDQEVILSTIIYDADGKLIARANTSQKIPKDTVIEIEQELSVKKPKLWSDERPYLYQAVTQISGAEKVWDDYSTSFGVRYFKFDPEKGFFLNGKPVKIKGVCNHHDLGCLGAAINTRAIERQLELLKSMGCNGIRTSHNPPAPELLDLCDRMGFIILDEAFDVWRVAKMKYDYHLYFDEWHARDMADLVRRDCNHPSVFIWSIGNEVMEQWDKSNPSGMEIAQELANITRKLDPTRPITAGCNDQNPENPLIKSNALDLIGYNYAHEKFADFPKTYPGKCFIATETHSVIATRGSYDMPSDSIRVWPTRWDIPFTGGNPDFSCSAYDNCHVPWGSTHAETWSIVKKYDFISGLYIWTGFDYLGEPTPYSWPARSSYFGIIDLAGFPKDSYYFYQSEWTEQPVLHIFPHWNWQKGELIDVWAYTNYDEVELFLNDQSLGKKQKSDGVFQLVWRIEYTPGTLKAVAYKKGSADLTKVIKTAGEPAGILLEPDRDVIKADGKDLSFITVKVVDSEGTTVPLAENLINFEVEGPGFIAGVDNGSQISHEPFKANYRKAFHGLCLAVIQSKGMPGQITVKANSEGLKPAVARIRVK